MGVQGAKPPAGARGVLATLSLSQSGPQARQKHDEWMSTPYLDNQNMHMLFFHKKSIF